MRMMRLEYLMTFLGSKLQTLEIEQYSNPRMTIAVAGPSVLSRLTMAPYLTLDTVIN